MSTQIDRAFVQTYHANIDLAYQQMESRLAPYCRVEQQHAEFDYYDRIGSTDPVEVLTRHGDTPWVETTHDRRRVSLRSFDWNDFIDRPDRMRMLADPTSPYTRNAIAGFKRRMDDSVIEAAFGTAYTGKIGATSTTFLAANIIPYDLTEGTGAAGGTSANLTVAKLRRARFLLDSAEADNDGQLKVLICGPSQLESLLATLAVTSSDYNTVKALVNGEIDTFMGFKFIRSNRLPVASNIRDCLAFVSGTILLAKGAEITVRVDERADKRYSTQVYVSASFGAVRMWEETIVKIRCDETVLGGAAFP